MFPLISVIIPVYNVEKYIEKCIDSVLSQTYPNIEIILVDDGSPDQCGYICDEYAEKYEHIKVIHKKNGGLSDARNCGLEYVSGELLYFLDSDDFLAVDCIYILYECKIATNSQIAVSDLKKVYEYKKNILFNKMSEKRKYIVLSKEEALTSLFYQNLFDTSASNKLYERDLFNDINFPVGRIFEDLATIYKVFLKAEKISFVKNSGYFYLQRENSIEHSGYSSNKLDMLITISEIEENVKNCSVAIKKAAECRIVSSLFHIWLEMPNKIEESWAIKEIIKKNRMKIIMDLKARKKTKIACMLSYLGFSLVKKCFRIQDIVNNMRIK